MNWKLLLEIAAGIFVYPFILYITARLIFAAYFDAKRLFLKTIKQQLEEEDGPKTS